METRWSAKTLVIDRASPVPFYYQLAQHFEKAIESGELRPGNLIDNEVDLAASLGISRPTVRQAILYLRDRELLARKRGHGTVILPAKVDRGVGLTSLFDDLLRDGSHPTTEVLELQELPSTGAVADALGISAGELVTRLKRVRFADAEPIAVLTNYLPAGVVPLRVEELRNHGLYQLMRLAGVKLSTAEQRMGAKIATAEEARLLDERRRAPLVTMERITRDASDRTVELAQHVYRASRYTYVTHLQHR